MGVIQPVRLKRVEMEFSNLILENNVTMETDLLEMDVIQTARLKRVEMEFSNLILENNVTMQT